MRQVWCCAIFLALMHPVSAQVHKWVDANGVTHYGERPPSGGKSKEVELRDASPRQSGGAGPAASSSDLKTRELEYRRRQAMRAEEETLNAQQKAQRDQACKKALASLINLRTINRLYELNERGERVYMSDAQRDDTLAKREAEYSRNCG